MRRNRRYVLVVGVYGFVRVVGGSLYSDTADRRVQTGMALQFGSTPLATRLTRRYTVVDDGSAEVDKVWKADIVVTADRVGWIVPEPVIPEDRT
jgi:deoxyribose-phosphate aldolase